MKQRRAAAPYAKALFALAKERNQTELVGRELGFSKLTSDFLALVAAHGRADHRQAIAPVLQSTWSSSPYTHNRARVSGNSSRIRCHSVQGNRQRVSLRFILRLLVPRPGDQPHMPTEQRSWARAAAQRGRRQPTMQVTAFSTPANPSWRWWIVNDAGEPVAELHQGCPTIAAAVAQGTRRLIEMNVVDRSAPVRPRSTSDLRGR